MYGRANSILAFRFLKQLGLYHLDTCPKGDNIQVSLVSSKVKVALIKPLPISRLELF